MKSLIVEDEFTGRMVLQKMLQPFGECHIAVNGKEALRACRLAINDKEPYDLVCLDILMPEMDGHTALQELRRLEEQHAILPARRSKVVMITGLDDDAHVTRAYISQCDGYLTKPLRPEKLNALLSDLGLLDREVSGQRPDLSAAPKAG